LVDSLNAPAAAKVAVAIARLSQGNFSNIKSVGSGVHEYRINFGPGYRMYFGRDGEQVVLLLGGNQETSAQRHRGRGRTLAELQTEKETGDSISASNP
jgi:putative addiction module killer protein